MRRTILSYLLLAGAFLSGTWVMCAPQPAAAGDKDQPKTPVKSEVQFFGNNFCGAGGANNCHGSEKAATELTLAGTSAVFARHNEFVFWEKNDRHKSATDKLTKGLGKEMAERLGLKGDVTDPKWVGDKHHPGWGQCLTCHGVAISDEMTADPESFHPKERITNGVSCVVCHGTDRGWVNEHAKFIKRSWPTLTREEKQAKYGLQDLWDPVRRAELCCSCHVGSAAEGKVVTHEMYAVGHPPLPSFEIVKFSKVMPRHWETMKEKRQRLPKQDYDGYYHLGTETEQQLRLLAVSAVVALRNTAEMIAEQKSEQWPEFALYDCYACHHDLKADSWRAKRPSTGIPGRPQFREWSTALTPLFDRAEVQPKLQPQLAGLRAAFSKVPFGDPKEVQPLARTLAESCKTVLQRCKDEKYTQADAVQLLNTLVRASETKLIDFDSARQVGWAMQVLLDEGKAADGSAAAKKPLDRLETQLLLSLPGGPKANTGEPWQKTMALLAEFDPYQFRDNLRELAKALPK